MWLLFYFIAINCVYQLNKILLTSIPLNFLFISNYSNIELYLILQYLVR
jgi:hypothetical protein